MGGGGGGSAAGVHQLLEAVGWLTGRRRSPTGTLCQNDRLRVAGSTRSFAVPGRGGPALVGCTRCRQGWGGCLEPSSASRRLYAMPLLCPKLQAPAEETETGRALRGQGCPRPSRVRRALPDGEPQQMMQAQPWLLSFTATGAPVST